MLTLAITAGIWFGVTGAYVLLMRELLFSSRVQRHVRKSGGWRLGLATFWARNLNVFDDHIRP